MVLLKAAYPDSCCFLYYGASELSYVTWLTDQEMNDNPACIGKPFPGVDVTLRNGEIYVDTPYSAIGITGPYSVGDMAIQTIKVICILMAVKTMYIIFTEEKSQL